MVPVVRPMAQRLTVDENFLLTIVAFADSWGQDAHNTTVVRVFRYCAVMICEYRGRCFTPMISSIFNIPVSSWQPIPENQNMSWTYSQSTGELRHNGVLVGTGYSGAGATAAAGRNNPAMQGAHDQGPIPAGEYHVGNAYSHPQKGPTVMALTPVGHNALGRNGFLIHGNNAQNDASQGCIILGPAIRQQISASGDTQLFVQP